MRVIVKEKKALDLISKTLLGSGESMAVAESVTAGLIQSRLSLGKDATLYFQGGVTAYNLGQKVKHLNVDPIIAERTNSVCIAVAQQMACSVALSFNCSWGIGITGYAAPVPALKVDSCFAFVSFAYKGQPVFDDRIDTKVKTASVVQRLFAEHVIVSFANYLKSANISEL